MMAMTTSSSIKVKPETAADPPSPLALREGQAVRQTTTFNRKSYLNLRQVAKPRSPPYDLNQWLTSFAF